MDLKQFATTNTGKVMHPVDRKTIADHVTKLQMDWSAERSSLEEDWRHAWAEYFSNSRSSEVIRSEAAVILGDVQSDWRHKVPTGKALELVEDANSYLQGVFFPNKQWFDVMPKQFIPDEDWDEVVRVLQKYIQVKLDSAYFQEWWDMNIRQCLITGTSVLALPWRYDAVPTMKNVMVSDSTGKRKAVPKQVKKVIKNGLDIQVVDMFDFFIDPLATDTRDASCIRRYKKTKGEIIRLIENGTYNQVSKDVVSDVMKIAETQSSSNKRDIKTMNGDVNGDYDPTMLVDVLEFWGDLYLDSVEINDVCATVVGDVLIDFKSNPFWGGKPYVITTFTRVHSSPYGIGLLSPVLGHLHQLYVTANHRLDISELVINPMWKVVQDGTLDLEALYSAPGKIIPVEDPNNIIPIEFATANLGVTVQEEGMLEARIERITGITPYVGQGQGRDAERVTAEEVKAKRDAGGNRLGRYHKHIEDTALRELLEKAYSFMQQFVTEDEVIRVTGASEGSVTQTFEYIQVGQDELQYDMDVIPVGSDWVVDKEREIRERVDFIGLVSGHPTMSQMVNWEEVMKDLARRMVKQDWDKFLVLGQQQAPMMPPEAMPPEMMGANPGMTPPPLPPEMSVPVEQRLANAAPLEGKQALLSMAQNPQQLAQLAT